MAGNEQTLEEGMVFSVNRAFTCRAVWYHIEDIVAVTGTVSAHPDRPLTASW